MSNDHEWLNLIEVSGPFLAVPVLREVFPQGLEALTSGRPQRLRRTYDEWRDAVDMDDLDLPALHAAWIDEVLTTALEVDGGLLRRNGSLSERLTISMPEHGVTVAPDLAVVNPTNGDEPILLVHVYEADTNLDTTRRFEGLAISPADRMVALLRGTGCSIGLVTNGERWMLVHAPVGTVAGFTSWYARLWGQEADTLRAFVSLLGVRRFFGPDEGKLPALYERSLKHQDDVTEALGEQVRRAVEVLVQALDRADQDRNRELLRDVDPRELYEAGLTVMMRLVFLLAAEERGLLLLGDPRYDSFYAISSLRMQLRADSEEILERRRSAWSRLLALFRGVYGGIDHPTLRLPALGGSLFDPDRYPFLEGRKKGTNWRTDSAEPLPIDDRTVLLLLEAIQTFEGRTLSYRALDVEQIGHVYEGLLERTVKRVDDVTLELDSGAKAKSPRVTLGEMESARLDGAARVAELLKERSERSESAIRNALERSSDDRVAARLLTVCRGDIGLRDRILPYASLLRTDPWGYPLVHHSGAFVVVLGADRRESGTHYTPKSLTEKIVEETLTPVAYRGPAEGKAPEDWELKSADELLDLKICDPAMGSGAFLVQACRWLSDRLVEAWSVTEKGDRRIDSEGHILGDGDADGFEPLSQDAEERAILARRLIAERCLYGVDRNPLAVELAKLSLWLTTMSKGRPFGFLDHNLRSGDSLLGIHDLGQLVELDMNPKGKAQLRLFGRTIRSSINKALGLRAQLRAIPIRDIHDVEAMAALDAQSRVELELPTRIADAFVGIILAEERAGERTTRIETLAAFSDAAASGDTPAKDQFMRDALKNLAIDAPDAAARRPFHWPIGFPEVFLRENAGFDAFVGNPPFVGGKRISTTAGQAYNKWLVLSHPGSSRNADLVAHFFRRAWSLLRDCGGMGLLATNSIAEGDTRQSGLEWMMRDGAIIYAAYPNEPWQGTAAVVTSRVHLRRGNWSAPCHLLNKRVDEISAFLLAGEEWTPKALKANTKKAFQGSTILGDGFILTTDQAQRMLDADSRNADVIFPYLNGQELNSDPEQNPSRYVINFWDWPEDRARQYEMPFSWLKDNVYSERLKKSNDKSYRDIMSAWWLHWRPRSELYHAIGRGHHFERHPEGWRDVNRPISRVLAVTRVSKTLAFSFVSPGFVYSDATVIFVSETGGAFASVQSSIHAAFAWQHSSRLKNDLRYSPTDALEPFPFPTASRSNSLEALGNALDLARREVMINNSIGLTKLYARIHSEAVSSKEEILLREIQREIDRSLADAFGWGSLDLGHGFHEVPYLPENDRVRFTISENARLEVLRRLAELNQQRYQEEIDQGLHGATPSSSKGPARRSRPVASSELTLDLDDILSPAIDGGD